MKIINMIGLYKKGEMVRWRVPMIFACNENPYKNDPAGSIGRRQAIFQFNHAVKKEDVDTTMEGKLRAELPNIILKAVRCYRWCVYQYGSKDFWHWTTPEMNQARVDMQIELNPWAMFLSSEAINYGKDYFVSLRTLCKHFKKFCDERILNAEMRRMIKTTSEAYSSSFADKEISVITLPESESYPHISAEGIHPLDMLPYILKKGTKIVMGIDIVDVDEVG